MPGPELKIVPVAYGDADAVTLIAEVQREYVRRYGGADQTPVDATEFAPPHGLFLVGYATASRSRAAAGARTTRRRPSSSTATRN